jgi:hypothetical protein
VEKVEVFFRGCMVLAVTLVFLVVFMPVAGFAVEHGAKEGGFVFTLLRQILSAFFRAISLH